MQKCGYQRASPGDYALDTDKRLAYSWLMKPESKDLAKTLGLVLLVVLLVAFMMARLFVLLKVFK